MTAWTNQKLADELLKVLAKPIPLDIRPRLAALVRGNSKMELRYEWVGSWGLFENIVTDSGWELGDGQEWVSLSRGTDGSTSGTGLMND